MDDLLYVTQTADSIAGCGGRLRDMVLKWLPVSQNSALEGQAPEAGDSPIKAVLRSKGFMWMSYSHASAFYWSHAGQHFEIRDEGDWCDPPCSCALARESQM